MAAPKNQFIIFAGGDGANTYDADTYAAKGFIQQGIQAGTASATQANTSWRQATTMAAMIGLFINTQGQVDALDDGDIQTLEASFELALRNLVQSANQQVAVAVQSASFTYDSQKVYQLAEAMARGIWVGNLGGTGDLAVATLPVILNDFVAGMSISGVATASNATKTPKLRVVNLVAQHNSQDLPIVKEDGSLPAIGDIKAGRIYRYRVDSSGNAVISGGGLSFPGVVAQSVVGRGLRSYKANGTYTFLFPSIANGDPYDVYWVYGVCVGAGGGGAGGNASAVTAGAGGGAGGTAAGWINGTPGQAITFVIGKGGAGAAYQGQAGNGGASSIGSYMSATGGGGAGAPVGCAGGPGGVGSGGQLQLVGGAGNDGNLYTANSPGGQGGSSSQGGGGRTATGYASSVSDGQAPGSGGGGIYASGSQSTGGNGGNGADGYASFSY